MQQVELTLEFYKIREFLKEYAKTELGREYIDSISFSSDKANIQITEKAHKAE